MRTVYRYISVICTQDENFSWLDRDEPMQEMSPRLNEALKRGSTAQEMAVVIRHKPLASLDLFLRGNFVCKSDRSPT
jgi:hypothetical protein